MDNPKQEFRASGRAVVILSVVGIVLYLCFVMINVLVGWPAVYLGLFVDHFAVIVGLPMAAALATILVALMPSKFGRIEFQAMGVKFKGGAAPIILWIICFIVIVLAIKLTW